LIYGFLSMSERCLFQLFSDNLTLQDKHNYIYLRVCRYVIKIIVIIHQQTILFSLVACKAFSRYLVTSAKLSENNWNKHRSNRFRWCHSVCNVRAFNVTVSFCRSIWTRYQKCLIRPCMPLLSTCQFHRLFIDIWYFFLWQYSCYSNCI
jgi:hypothetical protein